MSEPLEFAVVEIPARIANLAMRTAVPRDWNLHDLPVEDVDFSSPEVFFPLMLAVAPWAAVALTIAARPGFDDGMLQDWSLFLLDSQGISPTAFGPAMIGNVQGLAGVGRQEQEGASLEVRFAFSEDGGRLVYIGLMAPELISAPLDAVWKTALDTFALNDPQGPTVPLGPGMGISPKPGALVDSGVVNSAAPAVDALKASTPAKAASSETDQAPQTSRFTETELGFYAKSDDTATLDPEHPTNARLRNQGVGFVPNVLETDLAAKTAKVGAGAIQAIIQVALGWFVIDDGKRTMILDPGGKIQINLSVIAKEGRDTGQILDDIQAEAEQSYPNPEFLRLQYERIWVLGVRNITVDGEPVEQVHMLTEWAKNSALLRARVTADPESLRFAGDYADLILSSVQFGSKEEDDGGEAAKKPDVSPPVDEQEPPFK